MSSRQAYVYGRSRTRPWRVGVLVDTASAEAVEGAIADLSRVWGGLTMPIIDANQSADQIERLGKLFDVDSLHAEVASGEVEELLRRPGWSWGYAGPWGPFRTDEMMAAKGLLPALALVQDVNLNLQLPKWEAGNQQALIFAALWGTVSDSGLETLGRDLDFGVERVPIPDLLVDPGRDIAGILQAGMEGVRISARAYMNPYRGFCVIRPGHPEDVVLFWNMRLFGAAVRMLPSDGKGMAMDLALAPHFPARSFDQDVEDGGEAFRIWGGEHLDEQTRAMLRHSDLVGTAEIVEMPFPTWPQFSFQGIDSSYERSLRSQFASDARWVEAELPALPLAPRLRRAALGVGFVASEVLVHGQAGLDPRLTTVLPPTRAHSKLIRPYDGGERVARGRVIPSGIAFGADAASDHLRYPLFLSDQALGLLFSESTQVAQSDAGRFQTRAGVKFGGTFGGLLNEPGVREVLMVAARRPTGMTLPHLRDVVQHHRGPWPDAMFGPQISPEQYATDRINYLLKEGVFVPSMRTRCSRCRVDNFVPAEDLSSFMVCEFCGENFSLALSQALAQPEWRFRLAAHLRSDQVQAMLPALAVMGVLADLTHSSGASLTHVLGLEVRNGKRKIEVDVAAYVQEQEHLLIIGEVKSGNRIDQNDVDNLASLRDDLKARGIRSLILLATLNKSFSRSELLAIRSIVNGAGYVQSRRGDWVPEFPIALTGGDLSQPYFSEDHPWRWEHGGFGLDAAAAESCRRNVGLMSYQTERVGDRLICAPTWNDMDPATDLLSERADR